MLFNVVFRDVKGMIGGVISFLKEKFRVRFRIIEVLLFWVGIFF